MNTIVKHLTPALFVSHGSPMNAIAENAYTNDLNKIGVILKNYRESLKYVLNERIQK